MNETIIGTVDRVVFKNEENGYSVFVIKMKRNEAITATGHFSTLHPGEQVELQGAWVMHSKFGRQFEAQRCVSQQPNSIVGLKKYLSSGLIKGIGKVYGEKLVTHFGTSVLEVIENEPDRLSEVPGIGKKRVDTIKEAWVTQKEISSIMVFLQEKGVSTVFATKIFKKYGHESIAKVTENPYRLAEDLWGVGFKTADKIAQQLGFEPNSVKRVKAGILHLIAEATNRGHLYCEVDELKKNTEELLELKEEATSILKTALHELYNADKIKLISSEDRHFITVSKYYFTEKAVANKFLQLLERKSLFAFDIDAIYQSLRTTKKDEIELNEDQQKGILSCLQNKVTIITGGPGTGKTTLIKKLLQVLDENRRRYRLAAPTGRAAKRMFEGTGKPAETLHRLLEFDVSTMGFSHNEQNALNLDFLIVDEASMIDIFLAYALLKATPLDAHVIFIGDIDQLPSVGAGSLLGDMIESEKIPYTRLTQIFRQAQDSMIVVNAHKINKGEFPASFIEGAKRDYFYIKEDKPEMVIEHLKKIFARFTQKNISIDDATVLVPMNRGVAGTIKLNQDLQLLLNGRQTNQLQYGGNIFKVGDKVMQIRNNYDKLVFNGDIGFVEEIDQEDKIVAVNFDGRSIAYEFDELNELVLAYAVSIHKSQGSEYAAVIVPLFMQHFMLLQRNLIYTAITRAKKLCIFIGQPRAIAMGVKNNKTTIRNTFLNEFLRTDLVAR